MQDRAASWRPGGGLMQSRRNRGDRQDHRPGRPRRRRRGRRLGRDDSRRAGRGSAGCDRAGRRGGCGLAAAGRCGRSRQQRKAAHCPRKPSTHAQNSKPRSGRQAGQPGAWPVTGRRPTNSTRPGRASFPAKIPSATPALKPASASSLSHVCRPNEPSRCASCTTRTRPSAARSVKSYSARIQSSA